MYARSTTVLARSEGIDAGIAYIRDEVMPMLLRMSGCVGMSMLVDRRSGRCIVTSAWRTEDRMHASEEELRPLRDRAAETLGGGPLVEEWEIAALHRDHPPTAGACVRATWVRISQEHADRIVELYRIALLPQIREFEGFCSASCMVNRSTGYAITTLTDHAWLIQDGEVWPAKTSWSEPVTRFSAFTRGRVGSMIRPSAGARNASSPITPKPSVSYSGTPGARSRCRRRQAQPGHATRVRHRARHDRPHDRQAGLRPV